MARPTEWRRVAESFVNGAELVEHAGIGPAVFAGETVGRVHVHYQCSTFPDIPLAPWANELLMGVRLQNNLNTTPDLDLWNDIGSEEWMWLEGASWHQELGAFRTDAADPVEVISAPADGGYRDIKAQRVCTSDGALWIQTNGEPTAGTQAAHWLNFVMSALIILPA